MATAFAMASNADAFSIAFDIKPRVVRAIIYLKQPERAATEVDLEPEENDGVDDDGVDDELASAPAATGAARGQPPTKSSASSRSSTQAKNNNPTPSSGTTKLTHAKGTPKAKQVDKNALSARGSPKGGQPSATHSPSQDDPMGESSTPDDTSDAKAPRRVPCYTPWKTPMLKAYRGPPPPDPQSHGKYVSAKDAGLEYGNPLRLVWVRTADQKIWETDARDGDHLGGFHREDG